MYEWNEDEPRIVLVLATEGFYSTRVLMLLLGAVVAIICHFAILPCFVGDRRTWVRASL